MTYMFNFTLFYRDPIPPSGGMHIEEVGGTVLATTILLHMVNTMCRDPPIVHRQMRLLAVLESSSPRFELHRFVPLTSYIC